MRHAIICIIANIQVGIVAMHGTSGSSSFSRTFWLSALAVLCNVHCCSTYNAAVTGSVTDDLQMSDNHATAAANNDRDDGYYQLPLPVEQIHWVDSSDTFHSCVNHIAEVYSTYAHHHSHHHVNGRFLCESGLAWFPLSL